MTDQYVLITDDPKLKRRTEHLTKRASVAISSDRRFFESNPDRWHRVRPSHPAEIKLQGMIAGHTSAVPPGMVWYTLTKQLCSGWRVRLFVANVPGLITADLTEEEAALSYAQYATAKDLAFETLVREKVCGGAS